MMHQTGERWHRLGRSNDGPPAPLPRGRAAARLGRWGFFLSCALLAGWAAQSSAQPPGPEKVPVGKQPPVEVGPPPKQEFQGFPKAAVRLPRLADGPIPLGFTPVPSKKALEFFGQFVEGFKDPENTLDLVEGRPRLLVLKVEPKRIQVGDPKVLDYNFIQPKEMTIIGLKTGSTVMNIWFPDPKDKTKEALLSYVVHVIPDPGIRGRIERAYDALALEINRMFPDSFVKIRLVGDKLAVSGQAKDIFEGTQILRIVRANAQSEASKIPVDNLTITIPPNAMSAPGGLPGLDSFLTAGGPNVINLIRVPGEQQVNLKVTVAEVNRNAARSIGLNFSVTNNQGIKVFENITGSLAGAANLPTLLDNGQISLSIQALKTLSYARSLAEPNLVALNGRIATFQAGGSFPVPVVTGFTGAGLQGVSFVPFGVQLAFTPIITDRDRIRLEMTANVSTRDPAIGANINNAGSGGGASGGGFVPGLNTRNFTTTVEMREGQTFAVAGLIQQNLGADSSRVPFLGDIPLLGQLTGATRTSAGEQELVVLVSPELVHPMEPKQVPPLPGSDLFEPSDLEFYVVGRIESRRPVDYRSPIMTDAHRMLRYHRCEQIYMFGPNGYTPAAPPPLTPGQ